MSMRRLREFHSLYHITPSILLYHSKMGDNKKSCDHHTMDGTKMHLTTPIPCLLLDYSCPVLELFFGSFTTRPEMMWH